MCFSSQGGDLGTITDSHMPRLYLLQWLKSDRALMMLFNDGTFQVNTPTIKGKTVIAGHAQTFMLRIRCTTPFSSAEEELGHT